MYAVRKGLSPGIYYNWDDCKRNVIGFSGSIYKKCKTMEEAKRFCNPDIIDKKNIVEAYTDGSYIKKNGLEGCAYGIYIPKYNLKKGKVLKENKTNNRAELSAIIDAIEYLIEKKEKEICIYTDSTYSILIFGETGKKYEKKNYKNVKNADLVKKVNELQKKNIIIHFEHVKAHTGNLENEKERGNDICDKIANSFAQSSIGL